MTSKNSGDRKTNFAEYLKYLGMSLSLGVEAKKPTEYIDLETFFLWATLNFSVSSRFEEGFLCWLIEYGHLLSPAKIRKLIKEGQEYNSQVLMGILNFISSNKIGERSWAILKPYSKFKESVVESQQNGPRIRDPQKDFAKARLMIPNFKLDKEKFLMDKGWVLKNCIEIRNRALFGSVVNADVASYLSRSPAATPYEIAKRTGNHKARVFSVFKDVSLVQLSEGK